MIDGTHVHGGTGICFVLALSGLIVLTVSPLAAGSKPNTEAVTEWQEAALNYEWAAEAQEAAADASLNQARTLRVEPAENSAKSRRGRIQACNLEVRAADLLIAASGNLDNAARTWRQAATEGGRESASYAFFVTTSDAAAGKATMLLRSAVDLCEKAAVGLAAEDELLSQAAANQKAAGIRERLATRLK